jgi:hypothetical protein
MALRATNQLIEVLGPGADGTLRVTSQYIEVLAAPEAILLADASNEIDFTTYAQAPNSLYISQDIAFTTALGGYSYLKSGEDQLTFNSVSSYIGPKWFDVTSAIEFEDAVRIPDLYEESVTSNIAFTLIAAAGGDRNLSVENELAFLQLSDLREKYRAATSELAFTTVATSDIYKIVTSELELSQDAQRGLTVAAFLQPITLVQTVRLNPINQNLSQAIDFSQDGRNSEKSLHVDSELELEDTEIVIRPWVLNAGTEVQWYETGYDETTYLEIDILTGLQDSVTVEKIIGRFATSPIWTSQTSEKALIKVGAVDVNATSNIAFTTIIPVPIYAEANSTIDFTTYADNKYEFPVTGLELSSEATLNKTLNLATLNNIQFISSFFSVTEGFSLCDYSPFVGSTTDPDAPQQLLKNIPVLDANASGVTLFYPWVSPTTTVTLRGPDLGNKNRLEFQRIKRETRGGTLIVWADPIWPKNERLVLSFSGLTEAEGQALLDFIYLTLGLEIGLIDWEGNWWRVVTMTPSEALTRNSRENLSINLEFEMTRSVLRGRSTNEITFVDTLAKTLIKFRDETSSMEFTTSADRLAVLGRELDGELEFTTISEQQTIWNKNSANELEFTTTSEQQTIWNRGPANELEFTTTSERQATLSRTSTNELEFTTTSERQATLNRVASSEIEYIEDAISSIKSLDANNEIEYTENVISSTKSLDADNELDPTSTLAYELV